MSKQIVLEFVFLSLVLFSPSLKRPRFFSSLVFFSSLRVLPPFSFFFRPSVPFFRASAVLLFPSLRGAFFSVPRRTHPGTGKKTFEDGKKKHQPRPSAVRCTFFRP